MRTLKNLLRFTALAAIVAFAAAMSPAYGGIDKKFFKKVADRVWSSDSEIFNPRTVIADSLLENNSAVIIAWTDDIDVDHVAVTSVYKPSGLTNRLKKEDLRHVMVKLLDQSAIEYYSDFQFGIDEEVYIMQRLLAYKVRDAFGARIHKPDGRIEEVDLNNAIEVGQGKKGKDLKTYKIAIPGLEPGDVLEYFTFVDKEAESMDLKPDNISICTKYPVLNRRLSISANPAMTVEYKGYNGVPTLQRSTNDKGYPKASLTLTDLPGLNFSDYVMEYRQLPFVRIQFLNNKERRYLAANSRAGGLYGNIHAGKIISELGDYLREVDYSCPVNGKAAKLVKDNFIAQKPDATPRQIADAIWLAVNYYDRTAKTEKDAPSGQFERALIFYDVLRKMNVYTDEELGVGILNPRNDVPTRDISAWDESRFVVKTPDAIYFMPLHTSIAPGEVPGEYKGETAAIFMGDRKKLNKRTIISEFEIPAKRVTENSAIFRDTVTIDDDDRVFMTSQISFTGGVKSEMDDLTDDPEWIAEVEDFFNIPANKRYKLPKDYDSVGRQSDLRTDFKNHGKHFYGHTPDSVTAVSFVSRGIRPDVPAMVIGMQSEFTGLVERLGNDISLSVGQLVGMPDAITDNERNRLLDVMVPFINQETHILLVKAPEGYRFDESSVQALSRNASDVTSQFVADAKITDEGDLLLNVGLRYKIADVPLQFWPNMMKVLDEASAFANSTVVLVSK